MTVNSCYWNILDHSLCDQDVPQNYLRLIRGNETRLVHPHTHNTVFTSPQ